MSSDIASPENLKPSRSNSRVPSHLYKRQGLYYFRVVIPDKLKQRFGRSELRISLRTAYRQIAKSLAQELYAHLNSLFRDDSMIDYPEIKRRMNQYLQKLLEDDHYSTQPLDRRFYNPNFVSSGEIGLSYAGQMLQGINDPGKLNELANKIVPILIKDGFLKPDEVTESNRLPLAKEFAKSYISYLKILERREKGDFLAEEPIFAGIRCENPVQPSTAELNPPKSKALLYSEALKLYVKAKVSDGSWKEHSVADHLNRLESFLEIAGDKPLDEITRQQIRDFRDDLRKLPPNRKRSAQYKDKTVKELLALNLEVTLNVATVNIIVEAVVSLLDWCVREEYLAYNPAKELQIKDTRQAIELRDPFSVDDLQKLFAHTKFADGKFKYPAYFWIPLIGLYTGMRLEEIAQLHCVDLYDSKGIWVIDINDRGADEDGFGKTVKNANAVRLVPIHKALVDLGLIVYHQKIMTEGSIRLFPDLKKTPKVGKYGKQPGKQFKAVVNNALENSEKKSFHSLRHTFADFYKQRGLQDDTFRQLYGHDIPELAARQYGSKFPPEKLYEVLSQLDYGLDLSHLKNSKFINPS